MIMMTAMPANVADEDRLREQVGQRSRPQQAADQADRADDEGEPGGQRRVPDGVTEGERRHRRRRHQGCRRLRADRQLARRPEHRVDRE